MLLKRKCIVSLILILLCINSYEQETTYLPVSSRIFSPFVFNPAIAGSKDFSSFDFTAILQGNDKSEILNGNTRLLKAGYGKQNTSESKDFSNFGIGGTLFSNSEGTNRFAGIAGTVAFHLPLGYKKLNFISLGGSIKEIYNFSTRSSSPNLDFGVYYYGTSLSVGFSVNNLLRMSGFTDSLMNYEQSFRKQYSAIAGYKILISSALKIILEPAIIVYASDSTLNRGISNIHPLIKLYYENLSIGSFFYDNENISLYIQYKFPGVSFGAYFELPKKSPYYLYKNKPQIELSIGLNISHKRPRFPIVSHW